MEDTLVIPDEVETFDMPDAPVAPPKAKKEKPEPKKEATTTAFPNGGMRAKGKTTVPSKPVAKPAKQVSKPVAKTTVPSKPVAKPAKQVSKPVAKPAKQVSKPVAKPAKQVSKPVAKPAKQVSKVKQAVKGKITMERTYQRSGGVAKGTQVGDARQTVVTFPKAMFAAVAASAKANGTSFSEEIRRCVAKTHKV